MEYYHRFFCRKKVFDYTDRHVTRPFVVCVHMRQDLLYRLHDRKQTELHCSLTGTVEQFMRFHIPIFVEVLFKFLKNCSSCIQ